jgi:hypothetical protein
MINETLMNDLKVLGITYDEFIETAEIAMLDNNEVLEEGAIVTEETTNKLLGIEIITYYLVIDGVKEYCGEAAKNDLPKRFGILGQINEYKRNNNLN